MAAGSLLVGLLRLPGVLAAAPPTTLRLSEYQKQDWQVEDGLPENNVRMVAQRADGTLLLATASGLATFDGQRFRGLPITVDGLIENEAVNAVLFGRAGDLWIGTDGRGVLHQTATNTVNISERAGRFNERVRMLHQDAAGVLWIATQNGIERFANDRLDAVSGPGMISGDLTAPFAEDGLGGMFFVTSTGLYHWANGVAARFPLPASDPPVALYRDPRQRLWVGTMRHVLELLPRSLPASQQNNGEAPAFTPVLRATLGNPVSVMLGDAAGNLWIGTRHRGIWRLTADGLSHWGSDEGLADDSIRSLFLDDEQNLWIGMLSGGLSRWRKGALAPLGEPEGFHASYAANILADSHGDLWMGTWGNGLYRRRKGQIVPLNPPGMPLTTPIRALAEDRKGQLWVGTWFDGVYRYDGRAFRHYLLGTESPGNAVSAILPDSRGGLWIGTYTSLFHFPSGSPDPQRRTQLLGAQLITCLIEDRDGSILVGTASGLYRIRGDQVTGIAGLPQANIVSLFIDSRGDAWAGTKAGALAVIHADRALPLPASSGLPAYPVKTAVEDSDGHLWLGTSRAIVRVSVAELHAVAERQQPRLSAVILGKADGMRSSECAGPSQPASTRTADGTLWFATTKGFAHTTDVAEALGTASPVAAITGWTLSNDAGAAADPPSGAARIDLDAGQPDILIFFNAKFLANPDHVEYRYRLAGYDAAWTDTRAHAARYRRLPPGDYRFEVQARFGGEAWSSPVAAIAIAQHPFFYQTWYFYLALALAAACFTVFLFRRRVQLIKGRIGIVLEERNRIARECHDTLMAGFAAISWQLEATAKLFQRDSSGSAEAARSCELARSMVSHCQVEARRIIWDLRDLDEVTGILSQALSRALLANQTQEDIVTSFEVEGDEMPLAPGCVHHLLCIGQEAYCNAVRHAQPKRILIRLRYDADSLHLSIRDDGCGMRDSTRDNARHGHFGIAVMQERARKVGGTLRVQSAAGAGTEVIVNVAFNAMLRVPAGADKP